MLARFGYGLGTIAAILMLFSGHHLASLQDEMSARAQARIQDEEAYARRIKAQLRTAQTELMKARGLLQTAEVDVIGLEATLLDARDKLKRTGHDVTAVGVKTKVKTRPIKKAVYRTIATRMPDPSDGFPEMGLARNEYLPDELAIP